MSLLRKSHWSVAARQELERWNSNVGHEWARPGDVVGGFKVEHATTRRPVLSPAAEMSL